MSHQIEQINETAFFASARIPAWHQLGTVVDHSMTATEVLETAHLSGWNVRKVPMCAQLGTSDDLFLSDTIEVPNYSAVIRDNPITSEPNVLGVVGSQYRPFQNEELCDFLDVLVGESGAHYETAGSLRNGRTVFVSMKLPETIAIDGTDGQDTTDFYITVTNTHDGTASLTAMVTPVRVVCANTLQVALADNIGKYRIRHTGNMDTTIAEVRRELSLTGEYIRRFEEEANRMNVEIGQFEVVQSLRNIFRVDQSTSQKIEERRNELVEEVLSNWILSPTLQGIRYTAWGGFNAVTEYLDHLRWPSQTPADIHSDRACYSLFGAGAELRQRAWREFVLAA